jgi:hypothetical protein
MASVINRPEVIEFFATHHWVASTDQMRSLGVTKSSLQYARRIGLVITPIPGVVQLAGTTLTLEGRAMVAQLAVGHDAFVSGPTAGALYGLREMPTRVVEVTAKQRHDACVPADARLVRTSWIDEQRDVVTRTDGLRVASPLRMLFGLASQFNAHRFARAAEDAWLKRLVTPDDAREYLAMVRRSGRTGVRRMNEWLERCSERSRPAQSGLELDMIDAFERIGLPTPKRQHPITLATGETVHLDIAWPEVRLAVEPGHSWWHGGELRRLRDEARDRACGVVGWYVSRFGEDVRHDLSAAARQLLAIYRRRAADLRSASSQDH